VGAANGAATPGFRSSACGLLSLPAV
jgi:hypothetical protein